MTKKMKHLLYYHLLKLQIQEAPRVKALLPSLRTQVQSLPLPSKCWGLRRAPPPNRALFSFLRQSLMQSTGLKLSM